MTKHTPTQGEIGLDGIEKAIRSAIAKGDAADPAFREKVYRQAFVALDKALQQNPNLTVQAAIGRRQQLQTKVKEIEQAFLSPAAPDVSIAQHAGPDTGAAAPVIDTAGPDAAAEVRGVQAADGAAPRSDAGALDIGMRRGEREAVAAPVGRAVPEEPGGLVAERRAVRPRGRSYAGLFVGTTIAAAAAIGLYWAVDSGFFLSPEERDTAVRTAPEQLEEESFEPSGPSGGPPPALTENAAADRDWVTIFDPSDPTRVTSGGGAETELLREDERGFIRVRATSAGDAVRFDIGQGVLERIAGRSAIFAITARAEEDRATQMSVECNLAALGDCGRKRYAVEHEPNDFLFEVALPDRAPGAGGSVAITPDIQNQGRAVDIFSIRVAISE